jgi:hypothetical protein
MVRVNGEASEGKEQFSVLSSNLLVAGLYDAAPLTLAAADG